MGLWGRLTWNRNQSTASRAQRPSVTNRLHLTKGSGIHLLGAFLFVGLLALVAVGAFGGQPAAKPVSSQTPSLTTHGQASSSSAPLTTDSPASAASSSGSSSTSATSSSGNGTTSTQVSVDGQPVAIPDNGSSHQTITTPNGQTSIDVSNNKSTVGSATNSSVTSTNLNVYSSTSSTNISGGN